MKKSTQHTANKIKQEINSIDADAQVILYGSRARGDENENSDWDVLILTNEKPSNQQEDEFRNRLYMLELEIEQPISVFVYPQKTWKQKHRISPFYHNVTREGIVL